MTGADTGISKDNFIQNALLILAELEQQIATCQRLGSAGIISLADAAEQINMIDKRRYETIKALVDAVHTTRGGSARKIWRHEPTDSYK